MVKPSIHWSAGMANSPMLMLIRLKQKLWRKYGASYNWLAANPTTSTATITLLI